MMVLVAIFGPLLIGWALLHRSSRRPGWGFVGTPMPWWVVRARLEAAALKRLAATFVEALQPALANATRTFGVLARAIAKTGTVAVLCALLFAGPAAASRPPKPFVTLVHGHGRRVVIIVSPKPLELMPPDAKVTIIDLTHAHWFATRWYWFAAPWPGYGFRALLCPEPWDTNCQPVQ